MSSPASSPRRRRPRSRAILRKCERACCAVATYFPLAFVYSLTTWAVYVEASIGLTRPGRHLVDKPIFSFIGIALYLLLNASYTIAVFTDPGSPVGGGRQPISKRNSGYTYLPTTEPSHNNYLTTQTITVSSTGGARYCKKCSTPKPDRTHHCSTCGRCVLKMDHHCPWLATCVGLRNYKAFLLFLIYTCLFCYVCFLVGGVWAWTEILGEDMYVETAMPAQVVLLAVISGIIGLVLTGFTGWHVYLAARNQTTIEALEKTRYLDPMRKAMERTQEEQHHFKPSSDDPIENFNSTIHRATNSLLTTHANAIPGATRIEEGEEHSSPTLSAPFPHPHSNSHTPPPPPPSSSSPATNSLSQHLYRNTSSSSNPYAAREAQQAHLRHQAYVSELDTTALNNLNAFDLGLRQNLLHLFGPSPVLWFLPVCNTTGDGWSWPASEQWRRRREEIEARRRERWDLEGGGGGGNGPHPHPHPGRQVYPQLRGGSGGPPSSAGDGMSLKTLHSNGNGNGNGNGNSHGQNWKYDSRDRDRDRYRRTTRRDWDGRGVDAESFEVSSDGEGEGEGEGESGSGSDDDDSESDDGWR